MAKAKAKTQPQPLTYDYDKVGDVLYLFSGEPYDTSNVSLDQHIVLRMDPRSHKIVGLMIHDLSHLMQRSITTRNLPAIAQAFQLQLDALNALRTDPEACDLILAR